MIAGDKRKLYPVALTLESAFCCKRMEMPVEAPFYFVLDEDIIYFGAYSILRYRRIVEKHDRLAAERVPPDARMQCKVCWYVYDPAEGCPEENILPGTPFRDLPDEFVCPDCGPPKSAFIPADEDH